MTFICILNNILEPAGNPAAERTSYFFINKISNIQSFIVFRWKNCVKLVNLYVVRNLFKFSKDKSHPTTGSFLL